MKDNVDLTENRDFRKHMSLDKIASFLGSKRSYPWQHESILNESELLFTGDKYDRKRKLNRSDYEQGLKCERCSFDFSNSPWNGNWGMCFKCENEMEEEMRIEDDLVLKFPKYSS